MSVAISLALVLRSSTDIGKSLQYVVNDVWKGKKNPFSMHGKRFVLGEICHRRFPKQQGRESSGTRNLGL